MEKNVEIRVNNFDYVETCTKDSRVEFTSKKVEHFTYSIFKRMLDVFISLIGLIFLFPFMLFLKIIFLLSGDKDTILFKQLRTGKNGKSFYLIKFRSMKMNNDVHDLSREDEFTKIGLFLRKTSLDELPQLINILRGEMSFIGPRPWIPEYYENMNPIQRNRVSVLPGVTGLAQISGRNAISVIEKINYDLEYVQNFSFLQDMKIACKTIKTVFAKEETYTNKRKIKEEIDELKKYNQEDKTYSKTT